MNAGTVIAAAAALATAGAALGAPPKDFEQRVEVARQSVGVPGLAIAIVENDQVTFSRGFGVRALGEGQRVDADTIFPTGSTGKAFTVADLAILVDQGRIGWDDHVTDRLPGFEMYDPWVTREITIRDLLVHRSGLGLGEGDLMFVPRTNLTRAESVRRLRYLKPASSFRYGFAYDNVLYMVAGQLIESVSGETWEKFTAEQVLKPAGMLHSTSDEPERFATADRAYPHARMDGGFRGVGTQQRLDERDELGRNGAPAGGLTVSANDMARWLLIQLHDGVLPDHSGKRLFSEAAHREMWKPVVLQPVGEAPAPLKATQPNFNTYALGWDVTDYAGTKIVWHGGAVFGFLTAVVLIPDKQVGFSIEINCEDGEIIRGLMYELLDHYLGRPRIDWVARYRAEKQRRIAEALKALQAQPPKAAAVGPSLPVAGYTGTYTDPWYGNLEVGAVNDRLTIDFKSTPRMTGTLEHYQYDTFVAHLDDKTIEPMYVTFSLDADGRVDRITMKAVSPLADFSYDYQDLLFRAARK
ncbi:MAG TPA: serine hydrolase [Steroidobacteraceae bacterium]|jgi:CubicO group peptidase (beta-lactamase class C family)|nr:serine hydrolase [Steroidobacteraceae bacterium]